jgi:hypothetical protein
VKFLSRVRKKNNSSIKIAGVFLVAGVFSLGFSVLLNLQVVAFIGLGLTFWGAIFAVTRNGKYVESTILDSSAKSSYSTLDRMINDLKFSGQGFYIPAYPQDVVLPDYLKNLKDPVVFISENFDGKTSVDELAAGKFLSSKTQGVFLVAPGSGIMAQMEKQLRMDLSKVNLQDLTELIPKCLTEMFNLTKTAEMTLLPDGAQFKATGNLYESFYRTDTPLKSVRLLGCPVVSAVASAFAKSSGKTVVIKEQTLSAGNCGVNVILGFVG